MRAQVETLVAEAGIVGRVHMDGNVPHEDLPRVCQDADVFILPSLSEGMPNVVLEAMGCGLPIVGTRVAGVEELIDTARSGWPVQPGSAEELYEALREVLTTGCGLSSFSLPSRAVANRYDWRMIAQDYLACYSGELSAR